MMESDRNLFQPLKNSRIETLCGNLGLQERRYNAKVTLDKQLTSEIDWDLVGEKLLKLKRDTDKYISTAFGDVR